MSLLKPIHKRESATNPENDRGIAICSCLHKLYSSVLLFRLQEYVDKHNLLSDNQIGFRKGKRTSDHIFILKTLVDKFLRMHKCKLSVGFIDFKKAYDSINRDHLFFKLKNMQIEGLFSENIKAMYKMVEYCIKVHGGFTDPIQSLLGLKQGCVLSPLLFNLFIDDIRTIFNESCDSVQIHTNQINHLLYGDDLILISSTAEGLQNCLNQLSDYCLK